MSQRFYANVVFLSGLVVGALLIFRLFRSLCFPFDYLSDLPLFCFVVCFICFFLFIIMNNLYFSFFFSLIIVLVLPIKKKRKEIESFFLGGGGCVGCWCALRERERERCELVLRCETKNCHQILVESVRDLVSRILVYLELNFLAESKLLHS